MTVGICDTGAQTSHPKLLLNGIERVRGVWGAFSVVATVPADTEIYQETPGPGVYRYRVQAKSDALSSWWRYTSPITVP